MIQRLKAQGAVRYDLNGINPETNPGVHHFKAGMAGEDLLYMPPRVSCDAVGSALFAGAARLAGGSLRQRILRGR